MGDLFLDSGATISDDGVYRYALWRRWDRGLPNALFIMLNPSTADASVDDPTIRRCIGFARGWGMGGIRVANLFPYRATDPSALLTAARPEGIDNYRQMASLADPAGITVAAWGAHKMADRWVVQRVRNLFGDLGISLHCLGLTKSGAPRHPLYVPSVTTPIVYALAPDRARPAPAVCMQAGAR